MKKPNAATLQSKTYWPILKWFYNGKSVPVIPSLLLKKTFITNFKAKEKIFSDFFRKQGTPLASRSKILENQGYLTNSIK